MAFYGADIGQLRSLSSKMSQESSTIQQIISSLDGQLNGQTQWEGPDATRFRSEWNGQLKVALRQVAEALSQASQIINRQASEQESASA